MNRYRLSSSVQFRNIGIGDETTVTIRRELLGSTIIVPIEVNLNIEPPNTIPPIIFPPTGTGSEQPVKNHMTIDIEIVDDFARGNLSVPGSIEFNPYLDEVSFNIRAISKGEVTLVMKDSSLRNTNVSNADEPLRTMLTIKIWGIFINSLTENKCIEDNFLFSFPTELREVPFSNWHRNIQKNILQYTPSTISDVIKAVRFAELANHKIGMQGAAWSYTNCTVSNSTTLLINTTYLCREINDIIPIALAENPLFDSPEDGLVANSRALVHVQAGIKIFQLNILLESKGLAVRSLGGNCGQSIAGAISTGTHGGDINIRPIADSIMALHIVGTGGQQWWIERETKQITDPNKMKLLREEGVLCESMKIVYDDDLFNSCLVSMGSAGIIYSVVIQVNRKFKLKAETRRTNWDEGKVFIRERILSTTNRPRFAELTLNSTRACWIITRVRTKSSLMPTGGGLSGGGQDIPWEIIGLTLGALGAFSASVGDYINRKILEMLAPHPEDLFIPFSLEIRLASETFQSLKKFEQVHELLANQLHWLLSYTILLMP